MFPSGESPAIRKAANAIDEISLPAGRRKIISASPIRATHAMMFIGLAKKPAAWEKSKYIEELLLLVN
jgi:hypothetical protein